MNWTTKAFVQRAMSHTVVGRWAYYGGQFCFGTLRNFKVDHKVKQGSRLLEALNRAKVPIAGERTVEIGTGWAPVLPFLFWLHGQKECHTYDKSHLLSSSLAFKSAKQIIGLPISESIISDGKSRGVVEERREALGKLVGEKVNGYDILERCNIHYHAPASAANTGLAGESVDIVYSNTVLEHIPTQECSRLFAESYRILRPGGCMLHLIDMSDHFAHSDPSISPINFLQFSNQAFGKYNTYHLYQNRLRAPTWRRIITGCGFQILYWEPVIDEAAISRLSDLRLDESFAEFNAYELCTTSVCVLAKKI
jgi:SAM-dependent methyltransferase